MKFKIPFLAVIIVAAICFINKEEIKDMFSGDQPIICEVCADETSAHVQKRLAFAKLKCASAPSALANKNGG